MIKKFIFIFLFSTGIFILCFQLQAGEYFWREAEDSAEYYPVAVKSDLNASDYIYIGVLGDSSSTGSPPSNGNMVWTFQSTQSGTFFIWCRVKVPWSGADSYWVKMDSTSFVKWENFAESPGSWEWRKVGTNYNLDPGLHTCTMAYSANQACLDKILITNDEAYTPTGTGAAAPKPTGSNSYRTNKVVDVYKNLKVTGKRLQDYNGNTIQLRGLVTHGLQWYPVFKDLTIPNLVQSYSIDIIRIAMYVEDYKNGDFWGGYLARPAEIKQKAKDLIDDAISAGIYVIISWHIHNNPRNFTDQAKAFFQEISSQYGNYANILYEICNEPEYTSWDDVKVYANTIIPAIRANDPDNIIIVGTPNWCQDLMAAANSPLTGYTNLLYSFHFYAASHENLISSAQQAIDMGLPVIVTEWGTTDYTGGWNGDADLNKSQTWIDWMNSNSLSWTNWSLGNKNENSCFFKPAASISGPWNSSDLTPSGNFIAQKLIEGKGISTVTPPPPPPPPPPSLSPSPSSTSSPITGYYKLQNRRSGKLLDVSYASTADGAQMIQWYENGGLNQQWQIVNLGNGYSKLINRKSGKLLDISYASTADGAQVIQWYENGGLNQQWQLVAVDNVYYQLINRNSGKVLDVSGQSTADGAVVIQWTDHDGYNQQWNLIPVN